jgi:hypothetical protein
MARSDEKRLKRDRKFIDVRVVHFGKGQASEPERSPLEW